MADGEEKKYPNVSRPVPWLDQYKFKPGQVGNPKGRNTGVLEQFRRALCKATDDGQELLDFALGVLRGSELEAKVDEDGRVWARKPKTRDKIEVWKVLLLYHLGKPPQELALTGPDGGPLKIAPAIALESLTDGELEQLDQLLARGARRAALPDHGGAGAAQPATVAVSEPPQSDPDPSKVPKP